MGLFSSIDANRQMGDSIMLPGFGSTGHWFLFLLWSSYRPWQDLLRDNMWLLTDSAKGISHENDRCFLCWWQVYDCTHLVLNSLAFFNSGFRYHVIGLSAVHLLFRNGFFVCHACRKANNINGNTSTRSFYGAIIILVFYKHLKCFYVRNAALSRAGERYPSI